MEYGIGKINGKIATDLVSIKPTGSNGAKINFLSVYEAEKLSELATDGLLGLSPKNSKDTS